MSDRKNKPNFKAVSRAIGLLLLLYNGVLWAVPSDYVVMKWQPQSGLLVTHHQVVDLPDRQFLLTKRPAAQALQLQGHDGQLAWVDLSQAQVIRGEFHGTAHADGWHAELDEFYFVVRAPQGWIKDLIMPGELDRSGWRYDWQQLLAAAESKGPQQPQRGARGGVDNRVNLLFLGDGYLAADEAAFNQHVDDAVAYMQTFEPYRSYRQFLSYDRLFLVSNETGADRPAACYTPASFVDTALDATYCTNSIQRLLTVDSGKVFTAAAAIPNWDQIVVIVNDQEYGGAGGTFSTISTNDLATDVFIHEYGHTFTLLADEYETPYPGYPACSDINGPPCQSNVTDETVRELIKWNEFIAADTPVPTPPTSQYRFVVGLFEGARYLSEDMYRPEYFCNMRTLGTAFCEVCKQSYVFRLYAVPYADGGQLLQLPGARYSQSG